MEAFFAFVLLLAWVVGTIWVFLDASVNSSQSAFLWGLVAFFGGILGVLLYALLGRDGKRSGGSAGGRSSNRGRSRHRRAPSHICQSCGEEYFTDRSVEIDSCRRCGGVRVDAE